MSNKTQKHKMPRELLVYACDYDDGKPIFAAAENLEDIGQEAHGERVGTYVLQSVSTFKIRRELN